MGSNDSPPQKEPRRNHTVGGAAADMQPRSQTNSSFISTLPALPQAQTPGRQRRSSPAGPPRQRAHHPSNPPQRYISKLANWCPRRCHHQSGVFSVRRGSPKRNSATEESASEFLRFSARDLFMRANKAKQSDEEISRVVGSRVFGTP